MVTIKAIRGVALSFPETSESPHFDKTSFRVGKKIFATYSAKENQACLKLSEIDQNVFSSFNREIIHPVPNKWGKQGWTLFHLENVPEELLADALTTAYCAVASKKLSAQLRSDSSF